MTRARPTAPCAALRLALSAVLPLLLAALTALTAVALPVALAPPASASASAFATRAVRAAEPPAVVLSRKEGGKGGTLTVSGSGWRPGALLMLLICGQGAPGTGVIGGTNSCANADGRAVTVDTRGAFSMRLPVAEPPKPCPCVVHVAAVTAPQGPGGTDTVDVAFTVAGHPTAPLPAAGGDGRLAVLTTARLEGSGGVLVWFGAPARRNVVVTLGNLGQSAVKDPVFEVGTRHGVLSPGYEEQQWHGTIAPGRKALVKLPVELPAGAHGDYRVSVRYGGKVLVEQPWTVGRPWGVTLFWLLLALVVPAALFRIGMAIVDRVRPPDDRAPALSRTPASSRTPATITPAPARAPASTDAPTAGLPWFTPDSAPSDNSPTTKGRS
ncbi:hypothetical protein ABZ990_16830 [Streptomyces sp. NPDC046203]|uniref:hypothetical protein n=1 Tax=Streptomyces sp. NPDC046203 TaxID=3154602 RepID=UPI0033E5E807